ncbi:MAG: competence/damage-inducible protein A [Oscillospiraceae bacterium]|nr:competence/damage-inducible protein A [Oscillospiraceae bacterium]
MNAEILAVGTELLMGQVTNTNASHISKRMPETGIDMLHHSVVGDNPERLAKALRLALSRSDIVIMTGGLGPTKDDLTKETVAAVLGLSLELHRESADRIVGHFRGRGVPMPENNLRQACLPAGCTVVSNAKGTAPGCIVRNGGNHVVMLPGPPSEMVPMFEQTVMPYLSSLTGERIESVFVGAFGIGESALEERIKDLVEAQSNPTIATYVGDGTVSVRVTVKAGRGEDAEGLLRPVVDAVVGRLGDCAYSTDGADLREVTVRLLKERGLTLTLAESCTGGLAAAAVTSVPGASSVFRRSYVTYADEAKVECLGVRRETLRSCGAVSREVAAEMASGARRASGADLAVAITGIAGPDGATEGKPVGLVYVALAHAGGEDVARLTLGGDRGRVRNMSVLHALDAVRRHICGKG